MHRQVFYSLPGLIFTTLLLLGQAVQASDSLSKRADPNNLLLRTAIEQNQPMSIVESILQYPSTNIDFNHPVHGTPLMMAVERENEELVAILISEGANVNLGTCLHGTPLMRAIRKGTSKIATLLLNQQKSLLNIKDLNQRTALMHACIAQNLILVRLLLTANAALHLQDCAGQNALMLAGDNFEIVKELLSNLDNQEDLERYLLVASQRGFIKIAQEIWPRASTEAILTSLLSLKKFLPLQSEYRKSLRNLSASLKMGLLHAANKKRSYLIIQDLLATGSEPSLELMLAIVESQDLFLLQTVGHYNLPTGIVGTATISAVRKQWLAGALELWSYLPMENKIVCSETLLKLTFAEVSFFPYLLAEEREVLLFNACRQGKIPLVKALLNTNVNLLFHDAYGQTGLMWAAKAGYSEIVASIIAAVPPEKREEFVNGEDRYGRTAIMWALESEQFSAIKVLLANGAYLTYQQEKALVISLSEKKSLAFNEFSVHLKMDFTKLHQQALEQGNYGLANMLDPYIDNNTSWCCCYY